MASVKAGPERAALSHAPDPHRYIGGHPLAGRERSGPLAARADLFRDRNWVLTPSRLTTDDAFDRALELVALCEAVPVVMRSQDHDAAVAVTSHVPHLMAGLMAARLCEGPADVPSLAGQGLRDATPPRTGARRACPARRRARPRHAHPRGPPRPGRLRARGDSGHPAGRDGPGQSGVGRRR
ncbi:MULTISPECIES: prephenate dehydrogenase/arogenate dehydrogenase family protein [unclassified Streptomyces]